MNDERNLTNVDSRNLGRRTIIQGAAWSVPTLAFAVSAPTASASGCGTVLGTGQAVSSAANTLGSALGAVSVIVPAGATRMQFEVVGGRSARPLESYGNTVRILGDVTVAPNEQFRLLAGSAGVDNVGGKSLYGNGGSTTGGGVAGGAASAIVRGVSGMTPVVVAGGGGGYGINSVVVGGVQRTHSETWDKYYDWQLGYGGAGSAGLANASGENGLRVESYLIADPVNEAMWASGGQGGSLTAAGATVPTGGAYGEGASGPAGNGSNGGDGAFISGDFGAGGGGGGYFGGSGGGFRREQWTGINTIIAAGGGGGSSFVVGGASNVESDLVEDTWDTPTHGYVKVTFYDC